MGGIDFGEMQGRGFAQFAKHLISCSPIRRRVFLAPDPPPSGRDAELTLPRPPARCRDVGTPSRDHGHECDGGHNATCGGGGVGGDGERAAQGKVGDGGGGDGDAAEGGPQRDSRHAPAALQWPTTGLRLLARVQR